MANFTGNCLCGEVSFKGEGEPVFQANCHCKDCRQVTGAAFATLIFLKQDEIEITGELSTYDHTVDSGNLLTKHFCGTCGSQMFGTSKARPGMIGLRAGQVNEVENIKPQVNVYAGSKLPCTVLDDNLTAFEKMPS